jgi:hypothetical protein
LRIANARPRQPLPETITDPATLTRLRIVDTIASLGSSTNTSMRLDQRGWHFRHAQRPRYTPTDRTMVAALADLLPRERRAVLPVTTATLPRRHRALIARQWDLLAHRLGPARSRRGDRRCVVKIPPRALPQKSD